jgi:hypothetical protein
MRITSSHRQAIVEAQVACYEAHEELVRLSGCGCVWDEEALREGLSEVIEAQRALVEARRVLCEVLGVEHTQEKT